MQKRNELRKLIGHQVYKTIGTPNIVRIIEWQGIFEYLNLKEGEKILDVACGGGGR